MSGGQPADPGIARLRAMIDAAANSVRHGPGVPFIPGRDAAVLAAWAAGGLLVAIVTFRWEPHRPRGHAGPRPARAARPDVG